MKVEEANYLTLFGVRENVGARCFYEQPCIVRLRERSDLPHESRPKVQERTKMRQERFEVLTDSSSQPILMDDSSLIQSIIGPFESFEPINVLVEVRSN